MFAQVIVLFVNSGGQSAHPGCTVFLCDNRCRHVSLTSSPSLNHLHTLRLLLTYRRTTSVKTLTHTHSSICALPLARHLVACRAAAGCGLPSRHQRGALSPQGSQQAQLRHAWSLALGYQESVSPAFDSFSHSRGTSQQKFT